MNQPGRINSLLLRLLSESFDELSEHIFIGGKIPCPKLLMLTYQAELHGAGYPASIKIYNDVKENINKRYHSSNILSVTEHYEKLQNVINLLKRIGSFRLRERNPYPEAQEPDDYSFTGFDYDISEVDDNDSLVKKLTEFYYAELWKEFEKKSDASRKRAAVERAKASFIFYQKYREYERSGFDTRKIEEIFGIPEWEQQILDYWIEELLPHGISTSVFAKAGMGKSNLSTFVIMACLIMRPNWDIITNLPLIFSPFMDKEHTNFPELVIDRLHFVIKSGDLLMESAKVGLKGRIPAVILDEFDSSLLSSQMRGKVGTNLKDYMFVERHYDVQGPLFIYHVRKDIPVPMRNKIISHDIFIVAYYVNRIRRVTQRVVTNPDKWKYGRPHGERYLPIPRSSLPYHNQGSSPFDMLDVDMQWLNSHLTGTKMDVLKAILKLVPERGWEEEEKKSTKKGSKDNNPDPQPSPS